MRIDPQTNEGPARGDHDLAPGAACTLPARARARRLAWIREEILPHVIATERLEDGVALEMAPAPGLAAKLDPWIELERACCAGIAFARVASRTPGRLRLEVRGIDPEGAFFHTLGLAEAARPAEPRRARLASAAGVGALGVVACCLLPVLAVAALGAGAAPLAVLDGPVPIALAAGLGFAGAWWWRGRRRGPHPAGGAKAGGSCGPGC